MTARLAGHKLIWYRSTGARGDTSYVADCECGEEYCGTTKKAVIEGHRDHCYMVIVLRDRVKGFLDKDSEGLEAGK